MLCSPKFRISFAPLLILICAEPLRAVGYENHKRVSTDLVIDSRPGNTSDQDSDREPEPPTKTVDKKDARSGKRDAPKEAPAPPTDRAAPAPRGGRGGGRGGGFNDNETGTYTQDRHRKMLLTLHTSVPQQSDWSGLQP